MAPVALQCSSSEYKGELGVMHTAELCLAAAKANGAVNYALWRGDTDQPPPDE